MVDALGPPAPWLEAAGGDYAHSREDSETNEEQRRVLRTDVQPDAARTSRDGDRSGGNLGCGGGRVLRSQEEPGACPMLAWPPAWALSQHVLPAPSPSVSLRG